MGKLDVAPAAMATVTNGPEDGPTLEWHSIDWAREEQNVRRLRQRIFKASQEGDLAKVRNLQKLMLRSRSNTLVSVRRVTQRSSGRKTAGIDGKVVLTPKGRAALGTPQGGVISPLLLNIALHGMEQAAGAGWLRSGAAKPGTPVLIRYADLCRTRHRSAYAVCRVMPTAAATA